MDNPETTSERVTIITPILVKMAWKMVQPDARQWKQSMPQLEPIDIEVGVFVPLSAEYIVNREEILTWQIGSGNGKMPHVILTPKGMRYCIDALEKEMKMTETQYPATSPQESAKEDDDWDNWDDEDDKEGATTKEPKQTTKPKTKPKTKTGKTYRKMTPATTEDNDNWDEDESEKEETSTTESEFNFDE